jgi:hypothetical protein
MSYRMTENGLMKSLEAGGVLYVKQQMFNAILTRSRSEGDPFWSEGW